MAKNMEELKNMEINDDELENIAGGANSVTGVYCETCGTIIHTGMKGCGRAIVRHKERYFGEEHKCYIV